jgi:hypothetical protein
MPNITGEDCIQEPDGFGEDTWGSSSKERKLIEPGWRRRKGVFREGVTTLTLTGRVWELRGRQDGRERLHRQRKSLGCQWESGIKVDWDGDCAFEKWEIVAWWGGIMTDHRPQKAVKTLAWCSDSQNANFPWPSNKYMGKSLFFHTRSQP